MYEFDTSARLEPFPNPCRYDEVMWPSGSTQLYLYVKMQAFWEWGRGRARVPAPLPQFTNTLEAPLLTVPEAIEILTLSAGRALAQVVADQIIDLLKDMEGLCG